MNINDEKDSKNTDNVTQLPASKVKSNNTRIIFGIFDARDESLVPLQILLLILACIESFQGIYNIINPGKSATPHVYAHLGAYTLAYASALFVIAFRPARARGLLVIIVVAMLGFIATSIIDVISGRTALPGETEHLTKLIPPIVVWLIAMRVVNFSKLKK